MLVLLSTSLDKTWEGLTTKPSHASVTPMNATERMTFLAELDLDLETTLAVMRLDYEIEEIGEALDSMPRPVLDHWRDTIRLIEMPRGKKKF